jgi:hypothetical protein
MLNFCTLFDSNYLARGLSMHQSLQRKSSPFQLYVLAFDESSRTYLQKANITNLTVITMDEFQDPELLSVKPGRTNAEYCWTCTPSLILYCIEKFGLEDCTYIDADMIFYDDPKILIDEDPSASVIISEHRYTRDFDVSATHGVYCVQFMYFKNNEDGRTALKWWRDRCLEWCYAYLEDGKFGDQKYLDDWTSRFSGVHVMKHEGAGVAPWNLQQFEFKIDDGKIFLQLVGARHWHPLIFFHFHGLKFYSNHMLSLTGTMYDIGDDVKQIIFIPYVKSLLEMERSIRKTGTNFNPNGRNNPSPSKWNIFIQFIKERIILILKGKINPFRMSKLNFRHFNHYYPINQF